MKNAFLFDQTPFKRKGPRISAAGSRSSHMPGEVRASLYHLKETISALPPEVKWQRERRYQELMRSLGRKPPRRSGGFE